MSNKKLIVMASLLALCLCGPEKKSCNRPATGWKHLGDLENYLECIKTITGAIPYGKRSISPFYQKFHPLSRGYDPNYLEAIFYRLFKAEQEMQA